MNDKVKVDFLLNTDDVAEVINNYQGRIATKVQQDKFERDAAELANCFLPADLAKLLIILIAEPYVTAQLGKVSN